MHELPEFLNKISLSDLVLLTHTEDRAYCRFFNKGQYVDRMYVTDPDLLKQLLVYTDDGEKIDIASISKIKQLYLAL